MDISTGEADSSSVGLRWLLTGRDSAALDIAGAPEACANRLCDCRRGPYRLAGRVPECRCM